MSCGWGGNRRPGVALAVRHRLQWSIRLGVHSLRQGDEHPAYAPRRVWHLYLDLIYELYDFTCDGRLLIHQRHSHTCRPGARFSKLLKIFLSSKIFLSFS